MKHAFFIFLSLIIISCSQAQSVGIGTTSPNTSAALDITSSTGSLLIPRLSNTDRNALTPVPGMMIYNTDANKFQGYAASTGTLAVDQSQTSLNTVLGNNSWQEFKAGVTGKMTKVKVHLQEAEAHVLKIYAGTGISGTLLYSQNFTSLAAGPNYWPTNPTEIILTVPVDVISGNSYTLNIPGNATWHIQYGGNVYAAGTSSEGATNDFAFETYVIPSTLGWVDLH